MKKPLLLFIIPFLSFGQTPCLDAVANATGLIGEFIPQCEEDGSYVPIQCWSSTGYCWCVDENGIEIPGTSLGPGQGTPDCEGFGQNMCGGVTTILESFNTATIDIVVSTENSPNFWCSYCGLVLRDNDENIVAIENPYSGGSFYGLAGGYTELRILEIINNFQLPFSGVLHAMNGLMPNVLVDENFIVNPENPIDMIDGDSPFTMCSWDFQLNSEGLVGCILSDGTFVNNGWSGSGVGDNWCNDCFCDDGILVCSYMDCGGVGIIETINNRLIIKTVDILGREITSKGFQLHIYDDGSVEKKYLIK